MIGKISARGARVAGLMYYLYGPGRNEAHTYPHLVAGWRHPSELEPPLRGDGRRDFRHLNGLLQQPHAALGPRGFNRPVWHCSVRAAPGDRMLSDDEWAQVARDIVHRTGLAPRGQDDDAVRWIAVRHAPDHMHIVAMLARQDGTRPNSWNDYYRVGEACRAAEERFGLRRTAPRDRTGAPRPSRAESEKARRQGRSEPPRITLRRAVSTAAAAAASEHEFFARLDAAGISVRRRYSTRNPGELTGYAVALPADTTRTGAPIWYSGGKLAPDLTLPKLRHRWAPSGTTARDQFTAAERNAIWEHAAQAASRATAEIRHLTGTDPGATADAAWATADTLHAAAAALGSREVHRAADSYARAARIPYGHIPRHTAAGTSLRRAARLLAAATPALSDPTLTQIVLIFRLAALIEAVADLRAAQRHAAQAAAARAAAAHLRSARCAYGVRAAPQHMRSQGSRTHPDFPFSIRDVVAQASKTAGAAPHRATPGRASRGPALPRPRGPTG
jgi:MobA/VirD2-like, nuclease domain